MRAWEPGVRLAFSLRGRDFAPGESTEVDVRFEGTGEGARVTVRQQGFEALGPAARRGMDEDAFLDTMSVWWADLLSALLRAAR